MIVGQVAIFIRVKNFFPLDWLIELMSNITLTSTVHAFVNVRKVILRGTLYVLVSQGRDEDTTYIMEEASSHNY